MTTMTSTTQIPRHHRDAADDGRQRSRRSRRPGARAFALGATIALVCAAIAWAAVAGLHHDASQTNATATPAAVHPATTSDSAGAATGGSTAGSGTAPAAGTGTGTGTSSPASQDVLALQRDLGQLNYYESPIDGVNGPATVAAIKDFQRANGLPADGIAGPATMAKIQQQMVTGDNQMGPSGPPVKPANTTPAKPANTTPATPANGTTGHGSQANGQSGTTSGGAASGGAATGGAASGGAAAGTGTSTGAGA
jgi:zinc D-Ala-D-Ala carboxypeptidase